MLAILLTTVIILLGLAFGGLLLLMHRVFSNVGVLDLEDYARRNGVVYIPVSVELAKELENWSKPLQMRMNTGSHPLLVELICRTVDEK